MTVVSANCCTSRGRQDTDALKAERVMPIATADPKLDLRDFVITAQTLDQHSH